MMNLI